MATIRDTPLVGSAEAADLLEIGPTNFSHLRAKMEKAEDESFPKPITTLRCGPIWLEADMVKFKKHYDSRRRRVRSNGDAPVAEQLPAPAPKAKKSVAKGSTPKPRGKTAGKATVTELPPKTKKLALAGKAAG
jgi:lysozyme family protein